MFASTFPSNDACPRDCRGCGFEEGLDQSKPKRSTDPDEVHVPRKSGIGDRYFTEREAFRPRGRPIMDERYPQSPIDHGCNRRKRIDLKPLTWPNAGSAQVPIGELSCPGPAVDPNKRLRCQDDVRIAHRY